MSEQPSKLRLRFETVGSIAAILVGVIALFVSWDQARVMRLQQHAQVWPALQIDGYQSVDGDRSLIGLRITNAGVGPAVVEHVALTRMGQATDDISPILARLPEGFETSWSTMIGRVVAAGDFVEPFAFSWPSDALGADGRAALAEEWMSWDVTVCYCSVFERCWLARTTGVGARPEAVSRCPVSETDLFEQLAPVAGAAGDAPEPEASASTGPEQ